MPKVHTHLCAIEEDCFDLLTSEMSALSEFPGTDDDGWLLGTLDEVEDLMALSRRSGLAVRFRDRGFPITTAWHWLGDGVGVAYMIADSGEVGQAHLMLSGVVGEETAVAGAYLKLAGIAPDTALPPKPALSLITLEREGYSDDGGYLLGMILVAPFGDCCGVPDDPT